MAYREVAMWEIQTVLERIGRGECQAAVAQVTGHCRKTIRRYVRTAERLGWEPGADPPTEALAAEVFLRHRPSGDRGPGEVEEELLPHLEAIRSWLTPKPGKKRGLRLTLVHGSPFCYMIGLNCPRPGAITDEVPEAEPIQVHQVPISGTELG